MNRAFLDSNVLVYAFGRGEVEKTRRALALLEIGGAIAVQSLNEFANVAVRKLAMPWPDLDRALEIVRKRCPRVVPLTEDIHRHGLRLARTYRLAIFDAMLLAAALAAKCEVFWSEDMHTGLVIEDQLRIVNPFA